MTHPLANYRDDIDALIGPLEEVQANLETLMVNIRADGAPPLGNFLNYIQIATAISDLSTAVAEIDDWEDEEDEPEEDEPEEDEPEEDDEEEDE